MRRDDTARFLLDRRQCLLDLGALTGMALTQGFVACRSTIDLHFATALDLSAGLKAGTVRRARRAEGCLFSRGETVDGRHAGASQLSRAEGLRCVAEMERCRRGVTGAYTGATKVRPGHKADDRPDVKRMKKLEAENARLKRMSADLALENAAIKAVLSRTLCGHRDRSGCTRGRRRRDYQECRLRRARRPSLVRPGGRAVQFVAVTGSIRSNMPSVS